MLSRTTFTPSQLIAEPIVRPAFLQAVPPVLAALRAQRTLELAFSLFTALAARKDGFGTVLGITAHEYMKDPQAAGETAPWVGPLSQQQLDAACPRNGEVRAIADDVARSIRAANPSLSARDFGNAVHLGIKDRVNKMGDPNFRAEMLVSPTGKPPNATDKGNVRLDLYENVVKNRTVCVYDFKTGEADLPFDRAGRFADYILQRFPGTLRIIIGQVRPTK